MMTLVEIGLSNLGIALEDRFTIADVRIGFAHEACSVSRYIADQPA
jgi:hypothetical protein